MINGQLTLSFVVYASAALVLSLNLLFLWIYSGVVRGTVKVAINAEDASLFGAPLSLTEPPQIARVLRAHANAQAAIFPFLLLGLLFVLAGGSLWVCMVLFGGFTVARLAHSAAYLTARQPWRTLAFIAGLLLTLALMGALIWRLAAIGVAT